jgi:hypothetical protein
LAYDEGPDTRQQQHHYDEACKIAINPLSIMKHVADGTLETDHVKHLTSMYPGVHSLLAKKITQQVMKDQEEGKKPSFKVRQGLSLLTGVPLESSFDQQHIAAAQACFAPQQSQPPKGLASHKSTMLDKMAQTEATGAQAREQRQQAGA